MRLDRCLDDDNSHRPVLKTVIATIKSDETFVKMPINIANTCLARAQSRLQEREPPSYRVLTGYFFFQDGEDEERT